MSTRLALVALLFAANFATAHEEIVLDPITVEADSTALVGKAQSASVGVVGREELESQPVFRPGEILEATPGLIITQHSGEGKANQYFLRGFNLDHGTNLRTTLAGMPVNQRSHGHGQGYTDLSFVIPELVSGLEYRKGPYYAQEGDFAAAGAVELRYADSLPSGIALAGAGEGGYYRQAMRPTRSRDAPWEAVSSIVSIHSTKRMVSDSSRYSIFGGWRRSDEFSTTRVNAYAIKSKLNLFSNFTYLLDDPVNGDQFEQKDRRVTSGLNASHE